MEKVKKIKFSEKELKVDLGCGADKKPGFIGVDINPSSSADVIWDLEKKPYPFQDGSVAEVYCDHVVEHLESLGLFLDEVYRICKDGSEMTLIFPHYSRSWFSNQHKRAYGIKILNGYQKKFKVISVKMNYTWYGWNHWHKVPLYIVIFIIDLMANLSPEFCERVWCYWFGGFDNVIVKARVKK
ncbi:MAG: methyltransferase domain-containing protein [Candidatus Nealsonbacteria bacterium]|nr:methyltransferase domain-containing protein [Candidatus Nealsonbacteria bacterium]